MSVSTRIVLTAVVAGGALMSVQSSASLNSYALPGVTDFDAWDNLTVTNPDVDGAGFPTFSTAGDPWPSAIPSLLTQDTTDIADDDPTGDAKFNKTSGFGYPAGGSIYSTPFGSGSYVVSDATPVADLETVIFQIKIGAGSSGWLDGPASLTVNGGTSVSLFADGVPDETTADSGFGPIPTRTLAFQWDVSGLGPISDFEVAFTTAGTSTTITDLQLDQGSEFVPVAVPEPGSLALLGLGGLMVVRRRRRHA